MAERSQPWTTIGLGDGGPYSADNWWEMYRTLFVDSTEWDERGPIGGAGRELRVRQSVIPGMSVMVDDGAALVYGGWYTNDAALTLLIAPNAGPGIRYDVVVLQAVWALQTIRAAIHQGVQGGPVPALTQNPGAVYEIPLAIVTVGPAVVQIWWDDIEDIRQFIAPRRVLLGIGDFETDLAGFETGVIATIGGTNLRGWELGNNCAIYATIPIPLEWGDREPANSLIVSGYVWGYDTGAAAVVNLDVMNHADGAAPIGYVAWGTWLQGVAAIRRHPIVEGVELRVIPGDILLLRIQEGSGAAVWYFLGLELYFRRR